MNSILVAMAAMMSQLGGMTRKKRNYCLSRWNWRIGPTPKRGSRRWRAMMAYRESIQGKPESWPTCTLKEFISRLEAQQAVLPLF
jgi:hypothetical protein